MPVYEFECRLCGKKIEERTREAPECPDCKIGPMKRVFGFALHWPTEDRGH